MTDDMMNLRSLVEKSADADLLRENSGLTLSAFRPAYGVLLFCSMRSGCFR